MQRPLLRLIYLPYKTHVELISIPGFTEGWIWKTWLGAHVTATALIEQLVQTLGVRKVIVHGTKTARVEYVVQARRGDEGKVWPERELVRL